MGIDVDDRGNIYVADESNHVIRMINTDGVVSTFAGSGTCGYTDATNRLSAQFCSPSDVVVVGTDVYVADNYNHAIRRIEGVGRVTTLAGNGTSGFVNATGTAARFAGPSALDAANGLLYVADSENHAIRTVAISGGTVQTLAGNGTQGTTNATGSAARFSNPTGIAVDSQGNAYVVDHSSHRIRKVTSGGQATTLAGDYYQSEPPDGVGAAALFSDPRAIAISDKGLLFVSSLSSPRVRMINPVTAEVTTYAGQNQGGYADGDANAAQFESSFGITVDRNGVVYYSDSMNQRIRKIES